MRVLVIGATGVLGREAVPRLIAAGHQVAGLARDGDRAAAVRSVGAQPVVGNLFDAESLAKAFAGRDAVLNLATRIPQGTRLGWPPAWRANDRVRLDGGAAVLAAARRAGVETVVQEGIAFVYADGGDTWLDEDSVVDAPGFLRSSTVALDRVRAFAREGHLGVGLRFGFLVDRQAARMLTSAAKLRLPTLPGPPRRWWTLLRPSDAGRAVVAALRAPSGTYNVVAEPVRTAQLSLAIAAAAGVSRVRTLPRGMVPRYSPLAPFRRSLRVSSARFRDATGWRPEHPTVDAEWF